MYPNSPGHISKNFQEANAIPIINNSLNGAVALNSQRNTSTPGNGDRNQIGKSNFTALEQIQEISHKKSNLLPNTLQQYQSLSRSRTNNPRSNNFNSAKAIITANSTNNNGNLTQTWGIGQSVFTPSIAPNITSTSNIISSNTAIGHNSVLLNARNYKLESQRQYQNEEKRKFYVPLPQNNNYKVDIIMELNLILYFFSTFLVVVITVN